MSSEYINVNDHMYSEPKALNALGAAINEAIGGDVGLFMDHHFTITIGGKSIAFLVGGPQIEALYTFIEHIASENMYSKNKDGLYLDWGEVDA